MMKTTRRTALLGGLALGLAGCASKFRTYDGPEVTRLQMFQGDGKTPEGAYTVDRRNPDSLFHLSIGISYPNEADIAFAAAQGREPGGDIFIHGGPRPGIDAIKPDWTAGCIAVSDREIEDIYAMVRDGTPIDIFA